MLINHSIKCKFIPFNPYFEAFFLFRVSVSAVEERVLKWIPHNHTNAYIKYTYMAKNCSGIQVCSLKNNTPWKQLWHIVRVCVIVHLRSPTSSHNLFFSLSNLFHLHWLFLSAVFPLLVPIIFYGRKIQTTEKRSYNCHHRRWK